MEVSKESLVISTLISTFIAGALAGYLGYRQGYADGKWAGRGNGLDSTFQALGFEQKQMPGIGRACETQGALLSSADGVLTCSSGHKFEIAKCHQSGLIAKDDHGLILTCDGRQWRKS